MKVALHLNIGKFVLFICFCLLEVLKKVISRYGHLPTLGYWKGVDEPNHPHYTPISDLSQTYKEISQSHPRKPLVVILAPRLLPETKKNFYPIPLLLIVLVLIFTQSGYQWELILLIMIKQSLLLVNMLPKQIKSLQIVHG